MIYIEEKTTLKFINGVEITISKFESKISVLEKLKENNIDFIDRNESVYIDYDDSMYLSLRFECPKTSDRYDMYLNFDKHNLDLYFYECMFMDKW